MNEEEARSSETLLAVSTSSKILHDAHQCIICFENQMSVAFRPCSHVACCTTCATTITECPLCRAKIDESFRLYFSFDAN